MRTQNRVAIGYLRGRKKVLITAFPSAFFPFLFEYEKYGNLGMKKEMNSGNKNQARGGNMMKLVRVVEEVMILGPNRGGRIALLSRVRDNTRKTEKLKHSERSRWLASCWYSKES